ncbi:M23 family metallopeptidase [Cellulophaga fucicola]|uniref:Peptidase family M23 n=1 Tax=Cellulophaga fucicola TaxID=76595 RepID=A0A1K1MT47_9FLAO|nr:M23 family metallopeptidase [Cellulophaga fucicola]SFW26364.1 Peptidase family M23 [Cellulophaga fucicola]
MKYFFLIFSLVILIFSCKPKAENKVKNTSIAKVDVVQQDTIKKTNGFDFPVGKPNAKGYYNAQKFTENNHLGDDWNGIKGGNSDLGDNIYTIANGYVSFAKNIEGGWGNVIRIVHYINDTEKVESLYAHCDTIQVKKGDYVAKGDLIGTIGNNNGQYWAHLHLELRNEVGLPIGGGYDTDTTGYLNPTEYIKNNRN